MLGRVFRHHLRTAGLHVHMGCPVDGGVEFLRHQKLPGHTVKGIAEAIAVKVEQGFAHLALDLDVDEDHFVDPVIVPFVMGGHLIDPLGHAGIHVAGEDSHRPPVVARALHRVPGAGVARTVVHQVEIRVIGVPAPSGAAADLPLVTLPCIGARILAHRLAQVGSLFRIHQDVLVGAHGIGFPDQLAGIDVEGGHVAANAELAARDADEHLVLDHVRGVGAGRGHLGIAVGHRPNFLAGLRVERDKGSVGLVKENLAFRVGNAAVDRVTAHHAGNRRILLWLVFPKDPALVI